MYNVSTHGNPVEDRSKHILAGTILFIFGLCFFILPSLFVGIAFNFDFEVMFPMPILPPFIIGMLIMIPLVVWGLRIIILGIRSNRLMNDKNLIVGKGEITKAVISTNAVGAVGGSGGFVRNSRIFIWYSFVDANGISRNGKASLFFSPAQNGGTVWSLADLAGFPKPDARVEVFSFRSSRPKSAESQETWTVKERYAEIPEAVGHKIDVLFNNRASVLLSVGKIRK